MALLDTLYSGTWTLGTPPHQVAPAQILTSGSKAQDKGDSRNHGLRGPAVYVALWSLHQAPPCWVLTFTLAICLHPLDRVPLRPSNEAEQKCSDHDKHPPTPNNEDGPQ